MSDFKVLTDREHVKLRSGMYAGSTVAEPISGIINFKYQIKTIVPALIKCVDEVVQNSIDEWVRTEGKFANNISISIENTIDGTEVCVSDNGRGIPVKQIGDSYQPVLAWTELRAGSNFDDSAGRITAGSHGMGSSIVNILSDSFIGIADDGEKRCTVTCSDGMANIDYSITASKLRGTTVRFVPSLSHFGLQEFTSDHIDVIRDRIVNLAILYPSINFCFNGESITFKNLKHVAKQFHESAIAFEDKNISMIFSTSGEDEEFRGHCYINGIYVKNGGSPVDYVMNRVIETLRTVITKKHKISVLPNQIRQHLLFACWISEFKNLKFDSQTKERITNSQAECSAILGHIDYESIAKKILNTPEIIDPMISAILYKKELADRLALAKATKDSDRANLRKISKFTDATNKTDRKNCMVMLCEGDCLDENTLIKSFSDAGVFHKKIRDLNIGDTVLTHKNNLKQVISKTSKIDYFIEFKTPNGNIRCSKTHRLFVYDIIDDVIFELEAQHIDKNRHKFIESIPAKSFDISLIESITPITDEKYDLLIKHEYGILHSSNSHRFMVVNTKTECYEFLEAKDLISDVHAIAL